GRGPLRAARPAPRGPPGPPAARARPPRAGPPPPPPPPPQEGAKEPPDYAQATRLCRPPDKLRPDFQRPVQRSAPIH
ncbi:MAG: OmpA family protein, partial [Gammaproteobacteria bacterium]|nr:OmpA family protein [Gammaproteobacteria bacterium]